LSLITLRTVMPRAEKKRVARTKKSGRGGLLVRVHGDEGETAVVVDRDMGELPTCAAGLVTRVGGQAMARLLDAGELLDVDVEEIAWSLALVAREHHLGLQHADAIELQPAQDATRSVLCTRQKQSGWICYLCGSALRLRIAIMSPVSGLAHQAVSYSAVTSRNDKTPDFAAWAFLFG
jgi:hypothetical protein